MGEVGEPRRRTAGDRAPEAAVAGDGYEEVVEVSDEVLCPGCGRGVPREVGQHALSLSADVVACPHCGATVSLEPRAGGQAPVERAEAAPPGRTEGRETFAGEETVGGVLDELSEKPGGPDA
jgi:hypothetical protein